MESTKNFLEPQVILEQSGYCNFYELHNFTNIAGNVELDMSFNFTNLLLLDFEVHMLDSGMSVSVIYQCTYCIQAWATPWITCFESC